MERNSNMPEDEGQGAAGTGQGAGSAGTTTAPTVEELQAQLDEWKGHARKHERTAKEKDKELEALRTKSLSADERAIEEAKKAGRDEATQEMGRRMAATECRAALTGIVDDPASVVEDLDLSRYVKDDGDVDAAAIKALRERWEKITGRNGQQQRFAQGNTGSGQQQTVEDPIRVMAREQLGRG